MRVGKKHIVVKPCLKQHAFLVDSLGDSYDFLYTPTLMFFYSAKWGDPNQEKDSKFGSCIEISNPKDLSQGTISTEKGAQKGDHSEFWMTKSLQY